MTGRRQAVLTEAPAFTPEIKRGFEAALYAAIEKWGASAPNPSVGCALLDVHGRILGVGAHPKAGGPHAEIVALDAVRRAGTFEHIHHVIVTLEPCAHYGRTPPCSERLLQSPAKIIWIGARDPNRLASGGAALLAGSGRQTVILDDFSANKNIGQTNIEKMASCEDARRIARHCQALLTPFASSILRHRPWISVKQALDAYGSMKPPTGAKTFTSLPSLNFAHRLRRATEAVITGLGTILADHPSFTVRHVRDHDIRRQGDFPRLLVVCTREGIIPEQWKTERQAEGFMVEICRSLADLPAILTRHSVLWAMVEAGPRLLHALREMGLWDDWLMIRQCRDGAEAGSGQKKRDAAFLFMRGESREQGWQSPVALLAQYDGTGEFFLDESRMEYSDPEHDRLERTFSGEKE